ncbi:hypothetical protein M9H77_25151 [Catharanthus roseus]|uniref:Uncharacterized protein n=1 Tax=Catharanthus roseus TaxID=4058 RepID=A0ACC0A8M9_CATRO|nr:hypothetical protein M9H77_25151 [Catharanthus roseus]
MCRLAIYYDFSDNKMLAAQLVHRKFTMLLPRLRGTGCREETRYNMPLLEAVGMIPTGKNFTVATAFIHIDQNLLAKLTEIVKDEEMAQRFANGSWRKLINEIDEVEYQRKLDV